LILILNRFGILALVHDKHFVSFIYTRRTLMTEVALFSLRVAL